MDIILTALLAAAAAVISAVITALAVRGRSRAALTEKTAQHAALTERVAARDQQIAHLKDELDLYAQKLAGASEEVRDLHARLAGETARLNEAMTRLAEQKKALEEAGARLKEQFAALSAEALARNNQAFLNLARENLGRHQQEAREDLGLRQKAIDSLVAPLNRSMEHLAQTLTAMENQRVEAHGVLSEQIKSLAGGQSQLTRETGRLVTALRTPAGRGNWGEVQLSRVVELAGMVEHCDFDTQVSVNDPDGSRLRPDLVVRLPGQRTIVVDAKTPLLAYLDAVEADDEQARTQALRHHARQVRDHVTKLKAKSYFDQFSHSPEFVVMFLPGESFFSAALTADPSLLEFGAESRVILATPTTLIALLKAVAYGWRQEAMAENARQISDMAGEVYSRTQVLADNLEALRRGLAATVKAYNSTVGSFEGRLLPQVRRFKDLKATAAADMAAPPALEDTPRTLKSTAMSDGPGGQLTEN